MWVAWATSRVVTAGRCCTTARRRRASRSAAASVGVAGSAARTGRSTSPRSSATSASRAVVCERGARVDDRDVPALQKKLAKALAEKGYECELAEADAADWEDDDDDE